MLENELENELATAIELARGAGAILRDVYATDFEVRIKADASPVTEADTRANSLIVDGLRRRFPLDGVVGEESAVHDGALGRARCWYVDPLDGTREFIARNGEFAVMIGLAVDGESRLGVVYQPQGDTLYAGVVGQGAFAEREGSRVALQVGERTEDLRLVVSRSHRSSMTDALVAALGIGHESRCGSVGLKIGRIAEGAADLYVHLSNKSSKWDACGPEAVLRAAGGRFTDLAGRSFEYRGSEMANDCGILACTAVVHDAVLPAVQQAGRRAGYLN